jgi:multidrug efflux pump subunit AcrA (membrane-fusion protein)
MACIAVVKKASRALAITTGILATALLGVAPGTAYAQQHGGRPTASTSPQESASAVTWLESLLHGNAASPPEEVRPVRTVVASLHAPGEPVSLTGHIRARTEESLAFRIDGRVIARRVDVGQSVKPGDLVAEIDPLPQQDALRAAQAELAAAEAALPRGRQ